MEKKMNLKGQFTLRAVVVYLLALALACILTEGVWGATCGAVGGMTIARNPEFQKKVTSLMNKGAEPNASRAEARKTYEALSQEDRQELTQMTRTLMENINWFPITLFVSAVVFGLVGFLGGVIARAWVLAGAVPALSFLTNNPVIRFQMAKDLSTSQKVIVVVLAQCVVCYLLAYCGSRLGLKRKQKKETADQTFKSTD